MGVIERLNNLLLAKRSIFNIWGQNTFICLLVCFRLLLLGLAGRGSRSSIFGLLLVELCLLLGLLPFPLNCNNVQSPCSWSYCNLKLYIRSFSLFTFLPVSSLPTLLPASCPATCVPVELEFVASARAALVSFDTGGGFPETGPVSSPTVKYNRQYVVPHSSNCVNSHLGYATLRWWPFWQEGS